MLHEANILYTECYVTSVASRTYTHPNPKLRFRPERFFTKLTKAYQVLKPEIIKDIERLREEIIKAKPNVIIALGDLSLFALFNEIGITKWRGSQLECEVVRGIKVKVIPTHSPPSIQRMYEWRYIAMNDLRRAERESHYPELRIPPYNFTVRPSFSATMERLQGIIDRADKLQKSGCPERG